MNGLGLLAAIFGAIATGAGAFVAWLLGRRGKSGRINTSEAETLWEEAGKIRAELRADTEQCKRELGEARTRISALEARVRELEEAVR